MLERLPIYFYVLVIVVAGYLWYNFVRPLGRDQRIALVIVNLLMLVATLYWSTNPFILIFVFFVVNFVAKIILFKRQGSVLDALEDQLANALLIISGALKAGRSLEQGFSLVERGMPSPISDEFRQVLQEQHLGVSFEESLRNFMRRTPSKDYKLFLTATLFQRETGGNLIALYDQIIFAVTERRRLKGRVENLTQQGRLTAYVMMTLPILFLGFLLVTKPSHIWRLTEGPYATFYFFGPFLMLTVGIVWLWTIVNKRIG